MEELIKNLESHNWVDSASTFNGSPIFNVDYGNDKSLRFWNDTVDTIDCDRVCDLIAELLKDDGLNFNNNSVDDGWNTISFEIFDNDLF